MDVSVIIVNFNTKGITKNCIDSVFDKTKGVSFEVILVDNASTDGSKELFEKDKRITYIYNEKNVGFGNANNIGYEKSVGNYLFLLNSDTYLLNDAISFLYNTLNGKDSDIGCTGTMLLDVDMKVAHSYGRFPSKIWTLLNYTIIPVVQRTKLLNSTRKSSNYNYHKEGYFEIFDVDYITGADIMINKMVADKYGLFDKDFFLYYEETEMQHRYAKKGLRRVIVEGPQIVHLEGKSNNQRTPGKKTIMLGSYFKYIRKVENPLLALTYIILFKFIYLLFSSISFPLIHGKAKDKMQHLVKIITL